MPRVLRGGLRIAVVFVLVWKPVDPAISATIKVNQAQPISNTHRWRVTNAQRSRYRPQARVRVEAHPVLALHRRRASGNHGPRPRHATPMQN